MQSDHQYVVQKNSQRAHTMQVLDFSPMKESLRTLVKVLIRNGMWSLFFPSERIHSLKSPEWKGIVNVVFNICLVSGYTYLM